jgi:hypothetical protein
LRHPSHPARGGSGKAQAGAVDGEIKAATRIGGLVVQVQCPAAARQCGVVRNRQGEAKQRDDGSDQPLSLPQREPVDGARGQPRRIAASEIAASEKVRRKRFGADRVVKAPVRVHGH